MTWRVTQPRIEAIRQRIDNMPALMQHHLPKLAEAPFVSVDRDTYIVEEGPAAPHAARHLALVDGREDA